MIKQFVMACAILAALTMGVTNVFASAVVVDFDTALDSVSIDPADSDANGDLTQGPNGLLDSAEMALVAAILANVSLDLSGTGGVTHTSVHNAWTQALASANTDLASVLGIYPQIPTVAAGYSLLGAGSFAAINAFTTGYALPLNSNYSQALALDAYLGPDGDADGDGFTNAEEYDEYFPGGGRSAYVAAALDPNVGLSLSVTDFIGEGTYLVNSSVELSVVLSHTLGDETFQWQADYGSGFMNLANGGGISGATTDTLTINPADYSDSGHYRLKVTNSQDTVYSPSRLMNIVASLPAMDFRGMAVTMVLIMFAAAWVVRRRVTP